MTNIAAVDAAAPSQDTAALKAVNDDLKPAKQADLTEQMTQSTANEDEADYSASQEEKTTVTVEPAEQTTLQEKEADN